MQTIVHESYAEELGWLAESVRRAHESGAAGSWREIGVLVRDNAHAADVFDTLTAVEIPVEIVGLKGLLRLPEVAEVVATLTLVQDLTANSELLALLTGPRWAIGPRDLALLGRRARELADARHGRAPGGDCRRGARAGPWPAPTRPRSPRCATRSTTRATSPTPPRVDERFGLLAGELRHLRAHAAEPLLELVRRIIDVCGIDVELASSLSDAARARRENLDLFVKAVAEFQAIDGAVTLPALLAWLDAEQDGEGLDVATPSPADSVKLLTVHRAKGLEWDVVFLAGVCESRFPHTTSRGLWPHRVELLPTPLRGDRRDLPALRGHDKAALDAFAKASKEHEQVEELRLGYVAFTRAKHALLVSSYLWTEGRKTPLGPSPFQRVVREQLDAWGEQPLAWHDKPPKDTPNPLREVPRELPWPVTEQTAEALRRLDAAERVAVGADLAEPELDVVAAAQVAEWDDELERLVAEATAARSDVVEVRLPSSLSATALAQVRDDPAAYAERLARPMPQPPSPSARFGTAFHAWVEARFGQQDLIDPDELPGRADVGIDDYAELRSLIERVRGRPVRGAGAAPDRGRVLAGARGPGAARPDRRGLHRARRRLPGRRLEDRPAGGRRPAPARPLPAGLGRAARPARGAGAGRLLLRADRRPGRASRPAGPRGPRGGSSEPGPRRSGQPVAAVSATSTIRPKVCSRSWLVVSSPVTMWSETVQIASARRPYFAASV